MEAKKRQVHGRGRYRERAEAVVKEMAGGGGWVGERESVGTLRARGRVERVEQSSLERQAPMMLFVSRPRTRETDAREFLCALL